MFASANAYIFMQCVKITSAIKAYIAFNCRDEDIAAGDAMGIVKTTETWVRIELFCDGIGDDGICVRGPGDELDRLSDVAPAAEVAHKAILNATVKSCWRFDPSLQRWLCCDCVRARDASERDEVVAMTDSPPSVPQADQALSLQPIS
jgi:hypothetical protein